MIKKLTALIIILILSCPLFANVLSFAKKTISIGNKKITVEVAQTNEEHQQGLMFRKNLSANTGMLFIFEDSEIRSFWMKNTFIALSIGYFNSNKKLIEIFEMDPVKSEMETPKVYPSTQPAMYALEMPRGWFKKNNIKVGDQLQFH